jgi:hypothetical protein
MKILGRTWEQDEDGDWCLGRWLLWHRPDGTWAAHCDCPRLFVVDSTPEGAVQAAISLLHVWAEELGEV